MSLEIFVSDFAGAVGDQIHSFLIANTSGTDANWATGDLWLKFLDERGYTTGTVQGRTRRFLIDYLGVVDVGQTVADLWEQVLVPYSIGSLFTAGEQGVAYDPNNLSSLFQDSAGTTPVTATGQPVSLMLDLSGRGNHATVAAAASRPVLRLNATTGAHYLETDGSDDWLGTGLINFTSTSKMSVFVGTSLRNNLTGVVVELGPNISSVGQAFAYLSNLGTPEYYLGGTALYGEGSGVVTTKPDPHVASMLLDLTQATGALELIPRRNGAIISPRNVVTGTTAGTGTFGNLNLYLFRRSGTILTVNSHFYGLVVVGRTTTAVEVANVERLLAKNVGVTLA